MKKEDFKVYSNPDIRKRMKEEEEEVTFELEIPDEDTITALFISSPYFIDMMRGQDAFYYPTDLSAEETFMAPLLSRKVFWDFVEESKRIRLKESLLLAPLLHIVGEDEEEEQQMVSIFDGLIQSEFTRYFQTAVMIMNPEAIMEAEFEDAFHQLMTQLEATGYLDQVINNVAEFLNNPEVLEELIFGSEEEEGA